MVRLLILIMVIIIFAVDYDSNVNQASPTERSERTAWRFPSEAEAARLTCVRPAELYYTTSGGDCYRVPIPAKPYCPF